MMTWVCKNSPIYWYPPNVNICLLYNTGTSRVGSLIPLLIVPIDAFTYFTCPRFGVHLVVSRTNQFKPPSIYHYWIWIFMYMIDIVFWYIYVIDIVVGCSFGSNHVSAMAIRWWWLGPWTQGSICTFWGRTWQCCPWWVCSPASISTYPFTRPLISSLETQGLWGGHINCIIWGMSSSLSLSG